ncbi:MAG: 3-methyl-2-oxobutanoate hydroxymethyltransferase [Alphaproteobacteria bacterium]
MSHQRSSKPEARHSVPEIRARKGGEKIVTLTAYTARMAGLLDEHCDILLVGDSLGMVLYGFDSTLPVTLEMMIAHGAAVVRGAQQALVTVDMPFGSYQESPAQAFANCARVLRETGAQAVKLEGGVELAETVRFLSERAIPVMGHVGLMPSRVNQYGGFKAQGKDAAVAKAIRDDAKAIAAAGAFALVIEGTVEPLAAAITREIPIPTIGIGASPACDGQVLVVDDMLGMFDSGPRFVKQFADLKTIIRDAAQHYAEEVRAGTFPAAEHTYGAAKLVDLPRKKG